MTVPPLDIVCQVLRAALGADEAAGLPARLGQVADWPAVIGLADRHHVLPVLGPTLARLGVCRPLPTDVRDFLAFVHQANTARNAQLRAALAQAAAALNLIGTEPLLLKGAIRLVDDLYPDPGWRIMADLDLLVPKAQAEAAFAALLSLGYRPGPTPKSAQAHQLTSLLHPKTGLQIELHRAPVPSRVPAILSASDLWRHARPVALDGGRAHLPDPIGQLLHLIVHDQLANRSLKRGRISLRALLEAGLLTGRMSIDDIATVLRRLAAHRRYRAGSIVFTALGACLGAAAPGFRPDGVDRALLWRARLHERAPGLLAAGIRLDEFLGRLRRLARLRAA